MPNKQSAYALALVIISTAAGCTAAPEDEPSQEDSSEPQFVSSKDFFRIGPNANASTSSCTYGEPCSWCTTLWGCCNVSDKGARYKGYLEPRADGCHCVAPSWAWTCDLACGTC
jgi:hypothetical protein